MDINKIVNEGLYKTFVGFNKDNNNLHALINYCKNLQPSQQSFAKASNLIKFYRLPIIIAFSNLYQKYKGVAPQTIKLEIKNILEDIAAWVNSLLQKLKVEMFQQIKFIFHWGRAKRKYNIQVFPHQVQFASYIAQLSKKREIIKRKLQKNQDVQEEIKELENFTTNQDLLFFEQIFVDFIKKNVVIEVNSKIFKAQNKEINQKSGQIKEQNPQGKSVKKMEQKQAADKHNHFQYDQLPYEQERKLPICCRSYFLQDEVIQQAENQMIEYKHYKYPFFDQPSQKVSKIEKIKKTLCGFLNNKGGTIFFGIKEHEETKKREIYGYELTERYKCQFEQDIFYLLKDILPEVQINCVIKWVPIKNKNKNQFLPGRYIAKVIIQRGAKDQVYSYIHDKVQKFVFKTQNEFLLVREPQKVLKFFRNKLQNPETRVYKLHNNPCREPLRGMPIYKQQQSRFLGRILSSQCVSEQDSNYSRQIQAQKKGFIQKQSIKYLIRGQSKKSLEIYMHKNKIQYKLLVEIQSKDLIFQIYQAEQLVNLKVAELQIYQIYTWVHCQIEQQAQVSLIQDIAIQMEKQYNCTIKKRKNNVFDCQTIQMSARFWIKVNEIGLNAHFIPATNMDK